jgi:hypothetical protein
MRLRAAVELGVECGLRTVGEAVLNVELHAPSLFEYTSLNKELDELAEDYKTVDRNMLCADYLEAASKDA